jgi:hypothetical protein
MINFLSTDLWPSIVATSQAAKRRSAAIAYLTVDQLGFSDGDVLVVDASDGAIASGQTVAEVIRQMFERGVELYSYDRLHAKFAVFDRVVYVSSANISKSSMKDLFEAGIATDDPSVRSEAIVAIERLKREALRIDERFLLRIERIAVKKRPLPKRSSKRIKTDTRKRQTWLLGVRSIGEPRDKATQERISKDISRLRRKLKDEDLELGWASFPKKYRVAKEAIEGDTVIFIWRETYRGDPEKVYRHETILANRPFEKVNRVYHIQLDNDDALTWNQFKRLAKRIGMPVPTANMARTISDSESKALYTEWNSVKRKRTRKI